MAKNVRKNKTQRGASMVEFALLVGLIAIIGYPAMVPAGMETASAFCEVNAANLDGEWDTGPGSYQIYMTPSGNYGCMPRRWCNDIPAFSLCDPTDPNTMGPGPG